MAQAVTTAHVDECRGGRELERTAGKLPPENIIIDIIISTPSKGLKAAKLGTNDYRCGMTSIVRVS